MSITVYIDGARDLPAADPNFTGKKRDSDSYVEIIVGKKKAKTKVVPDNKNPVWRERFTFPIAEADEIVFRVFDDDYVTDDLLGEAKLRISELRLEQGPVDRTLKLVPAEPFRKFKPGELKVRIEEDRGAGGRPPRPGPHGSGGRPSSPSRPPRRYSDDWNDYGRRPGRPGRYEDYDRYGYDSDYGRYGDRYGSDRYGGDRYGDRYGYDYGRRYYDDSSVYYGGSRYYDQPSRYYEPSSYISSPRYVDYAPTTTYAPSTTYGGRVISSGTRYPSSAATYLDAADGVLDGKYYGSRIISAPTTTYGAAPRVINSSVIRDFEPYGTTSAPVVLDDGYYGGRVISGDRFISRAPVTTSLVSRAPVSSAALALDSADGVIDGRYFGSRIVSGGDRVVTRTVPTTVGSVVSPSRVISSGTTYARPAGSYVTTSAPLSSTALAVDAADGVIDGRYYGSRIVQAPTRTASYVTSSAPFSSAALAVDAADGVLDGRYFGSRIVQASPTRVVA